MPTQDFIVHSNSFINNCLLSSPVSEIKLAYGPFQWKNLIDRNRLKKIMQVGIDVMCMHACQFWWAWLVRFRRYGYLSKMAKFPFRTWTIVHGDQKIQSIGISSKNICKQGLMSCACTPILVGVACSVSEISEILLPFKNGQISLSGHGLQSMVIKKFNQLESAQKIYASRD